MATHGKERGDTMMVMPRPPQHYVASVPKAQQLQAGPKTHLQK
jgi:hypothetical protein